MVQAIRLRWVLYIVLFAAVHSFSICHAGSYNLDSAISYLKEDRKRLTVEEVVDKSANRQFQGLQTSRIYFGLSSHAYWIKIDLSSVSFAEDKDWILELDTYKLNSVDLHYRNVDEEWIHQSAGIKLSGRSERPSRRNIAFYLPGISKSDFIYIRLDAHYYQVPVSIWTQPAYLEKEQNKVITDGLFYGIVIAILAYHFFIFLAVRTKAYLTYALFLSTVILIYLSGQGWLYAYVFSHTALPVANFAHFTGPFSGWLLLLLGVQFTRDYLNLPEFNVTLDKALSRIQWAAVIFGVSAVIALMAHSVMVFGILYNLGFVLAVIAIILCFYSAVLGLRKGQTTARYYLMATSLQFFVSIFMILSVYHLIPVAFNWRLLQWSSVLEMLIFSYGLSRLVRQLELDKQRINQELMRAREKMIEQLETINNLKDKVLSSVMESRLYPEFARLFSVMNTITYIQAIGNYSKVVYVADGIENELEIQAGLKDIEKCFDETIFVRIHKTYLIKQGQRLTLQRRSSADYDLVSRHFILPVGRKYIAEIKKLITEG